MDSSQYREAVAAELRAEVARQRKTIVLLAEETGIPARSLARRLKGMGVLDIEEAARIAAALHKPLTAFLPSPRHDHHTGTAA